MSNKKPAQNRPTDPFGGPPRRSNTTSIIIVAIAIAFFAFTRISNGGLGNLFGGSSSPSTTVAPTATPQAADDDENSESNATPVVPATAVDSPTAAATTIATAQDVQTPSAAQQPSPTANAPPAAHASDLPTVAYDELPLEAQETIALIESDGPFPYSRDGITFQNRERILPRQPEGYYSEYTVITPGSSDRGARRIVMGEEGEMYYTDDHYESFSEIVR